MPERPLLLLPSPSRPLPRKKKGGGGTLFGFPSRDRQRERLQPRFTILEQAFEARRLRLQTNARDANPEEVIVLETVGDIDDVMTAVQNIVDMEWMGQSELDDISPDEDFFIRHATTKAPTNKLMRGRLFLILTNQQALQQFKSMWARWDAGEQLPLGLRSWEHVFQQLRDVRPWGVKDRLLDTGVLDDWRVRIENNEEVVPCEIELWYRSNIRKRQEARDNVSNIIAGLHGQVVGEKTLDEIAYHALAARLPVAAVQVLFEEAGLDADLVQCENIQFFRASGQMATVLDMTDGERLLNDENAIADVGALGPPVLALLDGLPLQNHSKLRGRLTVDDPDGFEAEYPAMDRCHGTCMASLILHGDLGRSSLVLPRRLYVRPILQPDQHAWRQPRPESVPENVLVVDLVHRAVKRLFEPEGTEGPVAPQVCIINLSIAIRDRPFDGVMSPLARLLDWLSWKYQVLFVVSAGNHQHMISLDISRDEADRLQPDDIQAHIVRAVASDVLQRRLLSPAEGLNVLTVGASNSDESNQGVRGRGFRPYADSTMPSTFNAQGLGYGRSIKPDVLAPGGSVVLTEHIQSASTACFDVYDLTGPPGQKVAAPGRNQGDLTTTWYTRGTSNSTALVSRTACILYDVLEELRSELGGDIIDRIPRALWLKALIAHGASWNSAGDILARLLRTPNNTRQIKENLTRLLGYGTINLDRICECTGTRVTALGGGAIYAEQSHIHKFPLPISLSGRRGLRRLIISMAWFSPVSPTIRAWRRSSLWFTSPTERLGTERSEADWQAVQRGTLQHEIFEGERISEYVDGTTLDIQVNCRATANILEVPIPYALTATLEVNEDMGIDIYDEVRVRVEGARVEVLAQP